MSLASHGTGWHTRFGTKAANPAVTSTRTACLGIVLTCAACGSAEAGNGSAGPESGSFMLEVSSTEPTKDGFDYAVGVDLGEGEHAGEAVATPVFGQSGLYAAAEGATWTLTAGDAMASGQLSVGKYLDRWYEISLGASTFMAKVERQVTDGDAIATKPSPSPGR